MSAADVRAIALAAVKAAGGVLVRPGAWGIIAASKQVRCQYEGTDQLRRVHYLRRGDWVMLGDAPFSKGTADARGYGQVLDVVEDRDLASVGGMTRIIIIDAWAGFTYAVEDVQLSAIGPGDLFPAVRTFAVVEPDLGRLCPDD